MAVLIFFEGGFFSVSSCTELSTWEAKRASSFANFGFSVGFAWFANVLALVRRIGSALPFVVL